MAILGYNRRLGLVVAIAALWALVGMGATLGMVRGGKNPPPLSVSLGVPPGGVLLHGELIAAEQSGGKLKLTIGRPANAPGEEPSLPDDIEVTYQTLERRPPGGPRRQPPQIDFGLGVERPRRLPGGDHLLVGERYAIKFGRGEIRVFPRPAVEEPGFWRRMFERRRDRGMEPGPPGGPPGIGGPPGQGPGGMPPEGMPPGGGPGDESPPPKPPEGGRGPGNGGGGPGGGPGGPPPGR